MSEQPAASVHVLRPVKPVAVKPEPTPWERERYGVAA